MPLEWYDSVTVSGPWVTTNLNLTTNENKLSIKGHAKKGMEGHEKGTPRRAWKGTRMARQEGHGRAREEHAKKDMHTIHQHINIYLIFWLPGN